MNEMDLIRREIAKNYIDSQKGRPFIGCTIGEAMKIMLDEVPSAETELKWIPVTEALPEKKEMVLITNNKGHVRCGQYQGTFDDKNYRWWWKHNTLEEVLAWMPLPEPWRGE